MRAKSGVAASLCHRTPKGGSTALLLTVIFLACTSFGQSAPPTATQKPTLHGTLLTGAHRVVFLGDSITYSGQYVDDVEAVLRARGGMGELEFLDLGLPSETVSGLTEPGHAGGKFPRPDLHERLARVVTKTHPDLVFACYGMNDGIYYPYSDERFEKFADGIRWLHESVIKSGARIIHLTPPTFDPLPIKDKTLPAGLNEYRRPYEGYNEVLDRYSAWLMTQRTNGWTVIDLHTPMNNFLAARRRESPDFAFSRDGVHANDMGHWVMAQALLEGLGIPVEGGGIDTRRLPELTAAGKGAELLKLIHEKNRMLSDAWLTDTGHKRPGMAQGLPVADADAKTAELVPQIARLAREFAVELGRAPAAKP